MPGKKKKFIEKKNAVTFYLAHRSQKDPLIADETAPQRVLVPINQSGGSSEGAIAGTSKSKAQNPKEVEKKKTKEEEQKYGIYFDDDYDYLQHLRDSKEVSNVEWDLCERIYAPDINPQAGVSKKSEMKDFKLKLPSSVFESEYVEDVGLLNKAAPNYGPRPDLDPDVVAGLEDDFDYDNPENELEDNFMELAGCSNDEEIPKEDLEGLFSDDEEGDDEEMEEDESDDDTIGSLDGAQYNQSEDGDGNRSHFTSYSMSSSVLKRNDQLTLLDDRFEKMFAEYEGTEIGPLDCDEIEGHLDPQSDVLMQYAEQYEAEKAKEDILNQKILQMAVKDAESSDTVSDDSSSDENGEGKKWDCESILSTYSNTKNRPKLIKEPSKRNVIKISGKTGMPIGVLGSGLTAGNLKELNNQYTAEDSEIGGHADMKSVGSMASSIWLPRPKVETPEERVDRKLRVKEYKRERRLERKANTEAFKEEKKRQVKVRLNCKANVSGLKL